MMELGFDQCALVEYSEILDCGSAGGGCGERCEPRSGECAPLGGAGRRWHCAPAAARGLRSA